MGILGKKFLSQIKEFYDPYPVIFGEYLPFPPEVAEVARKLSDQSISIDDAAEKIMAVAGKNVVFTNVT